MTKIKFLIKEFIEVNVFYVNKSVYENKIN